MGSRRFGWYGGKSPTDCQLGQRASHACPGGFDGRSGADAEQSQAISRAFWVEPRVFSASFGFSESSVP